VGVSNRIPGEAAGGRVHVPGEELPIVGTPADGPVWALVRPENILLGDEGEPGTVESVMFLGPVCRSAVRLADGTLVQVQHRIEERRPVGASVHLRFDPSAVAVLPRE
jgi:putative spermidine/putrescine transport system ATP-binding protein